MTHDKPQPTVASNAAPMIEVGMVMVGRLGRIDRHAISATRDRLRAWLQEAFPDFHWQIALVHRDEVPLSVRQEPSALLQDGSHLRNSEGWDFGLLFTSADLISRYQPYALAVTSSALDLAIFSTSRVDPRASDTEVDEGTRIESLTAGLLNLCLHALGRLNGLANSENPSNVMFAPHSSKTLVGEREFTELQHGAMVNNLGQIADQRLEETDNALELTALRFYLHSAWINRHEIAAAVWHAKPWEFPVRLLRLSAAALSAMLILLITAESWHLASIQGLGKLSSLLGGAILITSAFVAVRQRLFAQRLTYRITEQTVITDLVAAIVVTLGMIATAAALLVFGLVIAWLFFSNELVAAWITSDVSQVDWRNHLQTNILVATLGILVGALGASFEDQHHFRHVVFVDGEL